MIYKTLTIKHHERHKNWGWAQMLLKGKKSLKIPKGGNQNPYVEGQTLQWKKKNNDLQNTTQKTNDQAPWTPQKPGLSSDALEG